jgi:hypothetical protein
MQRLVPMIALTLALTGCAAIRANETHWTEQLLTAAGFQAEPAATAEELAHLRTLEARVFVKEMQNGEARYVYADPDVCRCLYAGSEQQYQKYQKLRGEKEIAAEHASAVRWTVWDRWSWPWP